MQTLRLSDETVSRLRHGATVRGITPEVYAEELLAAGLASGATMDASAANKPFTAMQLSASAPSGRTASEIDTEISASRDEWKH